MNDADLDAEALKLFALLNVEMEGNVPKQSESHTNANVIWRDPQTQGIVLLGDVGAAMSKDFLEEYKVTHIVNCTTSLDNRFENDDEFTYLRFPVLDWSRDTKPEVCARFLAPALLFIHEAMAEGHNVLIHCLAGAHRAGATGVAWVMHANRVDVKQAWDAVRSVRSFVNPMSSQPLLKGLEEAIALENYEEILRGEQ